MDIFERLDQYVEKHEENETFLLYPKDAQTILREINGLRTLLGAAAPGQSYNEITKDLPRKEVNG